MSMIKFVMDGNPTQFKLLQFGQPGLSAYEVALTTIPPFVGTKEQWEASLHGPAGKSTYQSYLDTTLDNPKKTEAQFIAAMLSATSDASTTVKGVVQLATDAESIAGTDALKAVVPASLAAKLANFLANSISGVYQPILGTASATVSGILSSSDWAAFNGKQSALSAASATVSGILSSTDWSAFNGKQAALGTASATISGILSSTDWSTFNGKQNTLSNASATVSGILTSTDWSTFNSKQSALGFTPVQSVNGYPGIVTLNQDDVGDGVTYKRFSATEKTKLAAITGTNTGDQDLSGLQVISAKDASGGYVGKTGHTHNFTNTAGTFVSHLQNTATAARTYTFPDKDITIAGLSDLSPYQLIQNYTSSTSLTVATGSKTLTVEAGLKIYVNRFYRLVSTANPAIWMEGKCTGYSGTTLVLNIDLLGASGTAADWIIDNPRNKAVYRPTASYASVSIVLADVPGLTVTLLAGITYEMKFHGLYSSNVVTNGGTINLSYTGAPDILTGKLTAAVSTSAVATELAAPLRHASGKTTITSTGVSGVDVTHHIGFMGVIKFPVDTVVTIQLAAEVDTNATTLDILSAWVIDRIV